MLTYNIGMQTDLILSNQLTIKLGGLQVLHNVNLSVAAGQAVAIVGANGSGKTTLVKIIAGLLTNIQGSLAISGLNYTKPKEAIQLKQLLGYAPDTPPLYLNDTVEGYLRFIAHLRRIPGAEIQACLNEYMEIFDLISIRKQQINRLSKGTQQRINLAQAMLHKPRILLLDEPTNGLDQQHLDALVEQLRVLRQQQVTILIATHDYNEIIPLCDYLLKVQNGSVQKIMLPEPATGKMEHHDHSYITA